MSEEPVLLERQGAISIITINRPKTLNALDLPTLDALEAAVSKAEADPETHVLVFTGAGDKAFVAGGDIADLNSRRGLAHYLEFAERIHTVFEYVENVDKPTIGAINGWALGGGTELLLCLDIRLVAESAKLGLPEIGLGIFPGAGGTQRMIRQVPLCQAKEMMFTGEKISAQQAVQIGLVNRVVADADLMAETMRLAENIGSKSALTLKLLKRTLNHGANMSLESSLRYEQAMIGLALDSDDAHEGFSAFLEKRPAKFAGK